MLHPSALQDSLAALAARDSARALLLDGGTDLRYFPEAWFFLGLAASILAWCWRSWRELHGLAPLGRRSKAVPATEPDDSARASLGASGDADAPVSLRCPACESVVGDTRAPLGYLSVCTACGRGIAVQLVEGRARVVLRES